MSIGASSSKRALELPRNQKKNVDDGAVSIWDRGIN